MTAIVYADCEATSPNGKYTLEARSPHNGTINHKDGRPPSEDEYGFKYRDHQSEFRYRLIDNTRSGSVLWERWQERGEDSPHEVVVSDEGWSILRTHGFKPELVAVSLEGKDVIRVRIGGPKDEDTEEEDADEAEADRRPQRGNSHLWRAAHLQFTTAGCYWTAHSWRYFFTFNKVNYFVWRPSWGQRLVIDLTNAALLGEEEQGGAALSLAMREAETQAACTLLSDLAVQTTEIQRLLARRREDSDAETQNPLLERLRHATAAIHLAGVHRVARSVPLLRRFEEIDRASYSTSSTAMGYGWSVEAQYFRPILHHTLRLLGEEPQGFAAYHFTNEAGRFPVPERVVNRRELAASLNLSMVAEQVLRMLGSPDHVRKESHKAGKFYRWTEDWDYDFRVDEQWVTLRITWEEDNRKGRIARFEEVPSPWLHSDQREADILRF
jgi:hypothetical protein